jgi:hypothetical protein
MMLHLGEQAFSRQDIERKEPVPALPEAFKTRIRISAGTQMSSSDLSGDTGTKVGVCYLCGESLEDRINSDHIPPKLFFAPSISLRMIA